MPQLIHCCETYDQSYRDEEALKQQLMGFASPRYDQKLRKGLQHQLSSPTTVENFTG